MGHVSDRDESVRGTGASADPHDLNVDAGLKNRDENIPRAVSLLWHFKATITSELLEAEKVAVPNECPQGNVEGPFQHDLEVIINVLFSCALFRVPYSFLSLLLDNGMASNDSGAIAITNGDDG